MSINKHRSGSVPFPDLLQNAAALHLRETTAAEFPCRCHPKNTGASKAIDQVLRDIGIAIDPVGIEVAVEHLANFVQCALQFRLPRRVKPRIRHHPIGHEISQEKSFGKTEFLPAAKKQLLGLLHFLLTLNFCFALCHVQGSPRGASRTVFIGVVLSTKRRRTPDTICSAASWPSGHSLARGPATFNTIVIPSECEGPPNSPGDLRTLGRFLVVCATRNDRSEMNARANPIAFPISTRSLSIRRYGLAISIQRSTVSRVPPLGSPFEIINEPSASATFRAVRSAYPAFANSITG